jgi:ATP/maltotriose-dependent transcriptional regulator MalT
LYGPTPYDEVLHLAAELRSTAERAGVPRAVAFAVALRGEAALLKGDLDLAAGELTAATELHHALESPAGEATCLQRLAEVHLHRGERAAAMTLLQRALPLARWSMLGRCLLPRVYGTMIDAAADPEDAIAIVDRAEATLGPLERCMFCTIMLAVPAVRASAEAGDLDGARRWLATAEVVQQRWDGTAWEASLTEVRGVLARAEGREREAERQLTAAAALFAGCGQPLDAARCIRATQRPPGADSAIPLRQAVVAGTASSP